MYQFYFKKGVHPPQSGRMRKSLLVMKITTLILITAILQVSAATMAQKVTLHEKSAALTVVIDQIRTQTNYDFVFTTDVLKNAKPVTINVSNEELSDVLHKIFEGQPLDFSIEDKSVVIKEKETSLLDNLKNKIKAELAIVTITGNVQDETGQSLSGVTVRIKNANLATATDNKGFYSITVPDEKAVVVFSFVGFETQEFTVRDLQAGSTITLKAVATNLREVVVSKGYYSTTQELNTGNVTRIDGKDIANQPVSDPIIALEGRVPGLYIQQSSGIPGSNPVVRLRGQSSIANGNDPLYIVDGVPFASTTLTNRNIGGGALGKPSGNLAVPDAGMSPFTNLDPNNIESIEILKDADATAIYGSRGANGVILITTKRGKPGKTNVNINVTQGVGHIASTMDLMNTQQYLEMRREAFKNDGLVVPSILTSPNNTDYDVNGLWDQNRYTDWQKVFIGSNAQYTNVQTSLSGGTVNTQFNIGGGYNRQTTVFPGDYSDQKASVHFNLNHSSTDQKFHALFSASYTNDNNILPQTDLTKFIVMAPDAPPLYTPDGSLNTAPTPSGALSFAGNPMFQALRSARATTNNLLGNLVLSYEILSGLQLKTSLGYNRQQLNQTNIWPATSFAGPIDPNNRENDFATSNLNTWIVEPQISYKRNISKGKLDILVGMSEQRNQTNSIAYSALSFTQDAFIANPALATYFSILTPNSVTDYRYAAIYGRLNYNWEDKYLLNLTARRDGSSRFGPNNEFANFGAVGAAWIFSKEKLIINNFPWMSFGKIRASYGTTGNDQIGDYQYLSTYSAAGNNYQGVSTISTTAIANPHYGWEVDKKLEFGLDVGFFNDRIYLNADYYRNRSGNQLVGQALPYIAGFNTIIANLPAVVQNSGMEFALNTVNIKGKLFSWSSSINLTVPSNKLVSFPGLANNPSYKTKYIVGEPLYLYPGYHYTGVNPQTGTYTYQDVNGDGALNSSDAQLLKQISQQYYGGFQNNITYKNWQLDVLLQFVKQTGLNYLNSFTQPAGKYNQNQLTLVLNRWQNPGDNTAIEKFTTGTNAAASNAYFGLINSDAKITDASFIRLKSLMLSYRLPDNWLRKIHLQNLRIFIQGQNLFTLTSYQGLDPENQSAVALPPLRMLTAGLELGL